VSRSRRRRAAPGGGVSLRSTVSSSPSLRRAYYSWHSRAGVISRLPLLDDALSLSLSLPPSLSLSLSLSLPAVRVGISLFTGRRERQSVGCAVAHLAECAQRAPLHAARCFPIFAHAPLRPPFPPFSLP